MRCARLTPLLLLFWATSAARTDSARWTAELRIPLAQLRFAAGASIWGVNFSSGIARRDGLAWWAPIAPDVAGVASRFGELRGLVGLRPARRAETR